MPVKRIIDVCARIAPNAIVSAVREFLQESIPLNYTHQADYAVACGVDPSHMTKILAGAVAVSGRNLPKLLRGFKRREDQIGLLISYLRDEVPREFANDISVTGERPDPHLICEAAPNTSRSSAPGIEQLYNDLPSRRAKEIVTKLLRLMQHDSELRDLIASTVEYAAGADTRATTRVSKELAKITDAPTDISAIVGFGDQEVARKLRDQSAQQGRAATPGSAKRS